MKAHEITAFLQSGNKKKGDLHKAYQLAEDPTDWINSLNTGDAMEDGEDEDELADEVDEEHVEDAGKKRKRGGEKKPADTKAKKAKLEKLAKSKKVSSDWWWKRLCRKLNPERRCLAEQGHGRGR